MQPAHFETSDGGNFGICIEDMASEVEHFILCGQP